MHRSFWIASTLAICLLVPEVALAQPLRQIPGTRPFLPGIPIMPPNVPNSRVRQAASQTGVESTDFYNKNGYPKVLGDAIEQGNAQTTGAGGLGGGIGGGGLGGGLGGGIGGGGLGGGLGGGGLGGGGFGGGLGGGIGGGGGFGGFNNNLPTTGITGNGITGGGFSGVMPKGFGFGGTPALRDSWNAPLHGISR